MNSAFLLSVLKPEVVGCRALYLEGRNQENKPFFGYISINMKDIQNLSPDFDSAWKNTAVYENWAILVSKNFCLKFLRGVRFLGYISVSIKDIQNLSTDFDSAWKNALVCEIWGSLETKVVFSQNFPWAIALAFFWSKSTFVSELSHFLLAVVFFHAELKSALRFGLSLLVLARQPFNVILRAFFELLFSVLLIAHFRTS